MALDRRDHAIATHAQAAEVIEDKMRVNEIARPGVILIYSDYNRSNLAHDSSE